MDMNFRIHRARVGASRAALQDGDGDETEESSWNTLPLATEENLQRMVTISNLLLREHLFSAKLSYYY